MAPIPAHLKKGETPMTDLQFTAYMDIRDKYEALLQETIALRLAPQGKASDNVDDYQFKKYEEVRDECEQLRTELTALHKENTRLRMQVELLKSGYNVDRPNNS